MGMNTPKMPLMLTGFGITVSTNGVPACTMARVIIDNDGTDYCAPLLQDGVEIPWASFNTMCWAPASGVALSGPPSATALKVLFLTSKNYLCAFTNFCLTKILF
jgi:hypothetical protein